MTPPISRERVLALIEREGKTPDPECYRCDGSGVRPYSGGWTICPCLYISREWRDAVVGVLAEVARNELRKLRS